MRSSRAARKRERKKTSEEGEGVERGPQLYLGSAIIDCFGGFERFVSIVVRLFFFCDRIGRFRRNLVLDVRPSNLDYRFAVHTCE